MPKEHVVPYVAAGFREDAEKLLKRFAESKSLRFEAFAAEWRKLQFSLIFMGRENRKELTEFIEECYRITISFISSVDPVQKLGAVYLLYGLYFKQPLKLLKTPVRIRMCVEQVSEMYHVEEHFQDEKVEDLEFIIIRLFAEQAIHVCCCPIPMGPAMPTHWFKEASFRSSSFKDALGAVNLLNEKDIKNIGSLSESYEKLKKKVPAHLARLPSNDNPLLAYEVMKQAIGELEVCYNARSRPEKVDGDEKVEKTFNSLGQRRANLKQQQFGKAVEVGQSRLDNERSDATPSENSLTTTAPAKKSCGRPKIKKQRGRKKKNVEVEIQKDCSLDSVSCGLDEPGPSGVSGNKGARPKRGPKPGRRHYFEDDDDDDDDEE